MKLTQRNVPWVGPVIDSLYTSLPILSIFNFLSISTVLYATLREYLLVWVPWLTINWFLLFLAIITLSLMSIMYLFVLPSLWTFRNRQMHKYESELKDELAAIRVVLEAIQKDKQNGTSS